MKIGLSANMYKNAYDRWGDLRYKKLKEHGFSAMDFGMADTESEIYKASEEELLKMMENEKRLANDAGIEFSQVHGPWRWPARDLTEEDRKERMEKMKKSIYATHLLGCKNWVVHPIMPYGVEELGTENAEKTWELNLSFMSELLKTAKEYGVTICLENMPMHKFSMAKPADILKFVKTINDDNIKICLDTGHVSVFPDLSIGDEVRALGKEIRTLHVHDNRFERDLHLPPFYGVINWADFAKALGDIDFGGVFSLETLPPSNLADDIFETLCIQLYKIADGIIN